MMYPILCKVSYETLHLVFQTRALWIQILFSIVANWVVAPLVMVSPPVATLAVCLRSGRLKQGLSLSSALPGPSSRTSPGYEKA